MLNLILAVFWLLFAAIAFAMPAFNPDMPPWYIPETRIHMGWFLLVLSVYNLVRWRTTRSSTREHAPLRTLPRHSDYDEE